MKIGEVFFPQIFATLFAHVGFSQNFALEAFRPNSLGLVCRQPPCRQTVWSNLRYLKGITLATSIITLHIQAFSPCKDFHVFLSFFPSFPRILGVP